MDRHRFWRPAPHAPADDRSGVVGDHHSDFQPRVPRGDASGDGGQWTKGGRVGATASAIAAPVMQTPATLAPALLGLATSIGGAVGTAMLIAGGLILIPFNRSQRDSGFLPDDSDIHYNYDQGFLTIHERMPDGSWEALFHGRPDQDGYYLTPDGATIGRALDNGVYLSVASIKIEKRAKARTQAAALTRDDRVRFCPDPSLDAPSDMSARSLSYQHYITDLPPGLAVMLNGVIFDGCSEPRRRMLEAKGRGFAWALDGADFFEWFRGRERAIDQMMRQSIAAKGRIVEWHVAEKPVAEVFARLAKPFKNIKVIWTPDPAAEPRSKK